MFFLNITLNFIIITKNPTREQIINNKKFFYQTLDEGTILNYKVTNTPLYRTIYFNFI